MGQGAAEEIGMRKHGRGPGKGFSGRFSASRGGEELRAAWLQLVTFQGFLIIFRFSVCCFTSMYSVGVAPIYDIRTYNL